MFNDQTVDLDSLGTCDIIFANSVLCRNPWKPKGRRALQQYNFSLFGEIVLSLDEVLHVGGILYIINARYRFEDTSVTRAYHATSVRKCTNPNWSDFYMPLWSPAGKEIRRRDVCVYTKRGHSHNASHFKEQRPHDRRHRHKDSSVR